jgi:filamentous hemagglutinin family protein
MKTNRTISAKYLIRVATTYLLTYCMLFNSTIVKALNSSDLAGHNGRLIGGSAGSTWGDNTVLNTENGAILNWNNFNTSSGQTVKFNQYTDGTLSSTSAVLNRISSGSATQFNGSLTGNGIVYVVNPAGVYFGAGASVNVNQLVASGLSMSDSDFQAVLDNTNNLMIFNGGGHGNVTNSGTITANSVYLIGKNIINSGTINCPAGTVLLATGDGVYLHQDAGSIFIEVNADVSNITNSGTITANNGQIIMAAGDIFSSAITNSGTLAAAGGTIIAKAPVIQNSGTINVSNTTGDGGYVNLKAMEELEFTGTSIVMANAGTGNSGANGGDIIAKSDDAITVQNGAQFQTKGGSYTNSSGLTEDTTYNGGKVDIIGESVYINGGTVDASTTAASYTVSSETVTPKKGSWVIDAPTLTIAAGAKPTTATENTLYENWIEAQSQAGTNLEMVAHSTTEGTVITVQPMTELTGGSGDIAFRTKYDTGGIDFGSNPATIHTTGGGNIYMLAGSGGISAGNIISDIPSSDKTTEPGKIRLFTNNGGDITTGKLSVTGGSYDEVSIIADGDLTINGKVETLTNQVDNDTKEVGQARTCLVSQTGDVTINGGITVDAHGKNYTTADIHIDAGKNITINLNGSQISTSAKTSQCGPANATIAIHAGKVIEEPTDLAGTITVTGGSSNAVSVYAKAGNGPDAVSFSTSGTSDYSYSKTTGKAYGSIDINKKRTEDCPDCPKPEGMDEPVTPHPPIGLDDISITPKEQIVSIDVLGNDSGVSELGIFLVSKTTAAGGTVKLNPDGQVTYTPPTDLSKLTFNDKGEATDTFTYRAVDADGLTSDIITVTVTITNNLPNAAADAITTSKDNSNVIIDVLKNDTDKDTSDKLSVNSASGTSTLGGTVTVNSDGTITYNPPEDLSDVDFDQNGQATDTFTYTATDSYNKSSAQNVTVTLTNNIPVASPDKVQTSKTSSITINVLANDTDSDLDKLAIDSLPGTTALGGTVTVKSDGTIAYTPPKDLTGVTFDDNGNATDTFTYTATDSYNESAEQLVVVKIINNIPVSANDTAQTSKNSSSFTVNVLGNDKDADKLDTLSILSTSGTSTLGGTITINANNTINYDMPDSITFDKNGHATDTFTYVATDSFNNSKQTTVAVTIINNLPQANDDSVKTSINQPISSNTLKNDIDLDGDPLTVVIDGTSPKHGTVILNKDGTFTYTPNNNYIGQDTFTYIASDGYNSSIGTVMVLVGATIAAAPIPEIKQVEVSGCPVLMKWAAQEIGTDERTIQISIANTLASSRDIQPCDACAKLQAAAAILKDTDGAYLASLTQIINDFALTDAPPSEEQMALIANAISNNTESGSAYAMAGQYIDALTTYVGTLNRNLNLATDRAVTLATEKYLLPIAEKDKVAVANYLSARMTTSIE